MVKDYTLKDFNEDMEMCNAIIKRYFSKYKNHAQDLRQEGVIGILNAREKFNEEISKKSTFFWTYCYYGMLTYVKKVIEAGHEEENISLNSVVNSRDEKSTLEDILQDKDFNFDDYTELIVIKDVLRRYVKSLPKGTNIEKITKLTLLGYSAREIMEQLGCTISYINRIKLEFKAKLKIMLDKELR